MERLNERSEFKPHEQVVGRLVGANNTGRRFVWPKWSDKYGLLTFSSKLNRAFFSSNTHNYYQMKCYFRKLLNYVHLLQIH